MRKFVSETNAVLLLFITLLQYLIQSCARGGRSIVENMCYEIRRAEALVCETREEPGTLTQGGALFSLVPLVWESNPKLQGGWCKPNHQPIGGSDPNHQGVCVFITLLHQGGSVIERGLKPISGTTQNRRRTPARCVFITAGPIMKLCAGG